jgi:DNA-directed RNA polymerase subunit RPC12/RpoP
MPCEAPVRCSRCGNETTGVKCLICGLPQDSDQLTEFCRTTNCVFRRLMDDQAYQPTGSQEDKVAVLQGACRSCKAWQYDRFLK